MSNKEMKKEEYNEQELYNTEIHALIAKIKIICELHRIPFVCTFAVANEKGVTTYENDGILTGSTGIELYEDNFVKYLVALRGGVFIPPSMAKDLLPEKFDFPDEIFNDYISEEDDMITLNQSGVKKAVKFDGNL